MRIRLSRKLMAAAPSTVTFPVKVESRPYSRIVHVSQSPASAMAGSVTMASVRTRRGSIGHTVVM